MTLLVDQTNIYFSEKVQSGQTEDVFVAITVNELFIWFGLHMLMCQTKVPNKADHWNPTVGRESEIPQYHKYMSHKRFKLIKRYLHLMSDVPGDAPRITLIKPLIEILRTTFRHFYRFGQKVSLDEMMVKFKGRNPYHRYLPRKPNSNGFLIHALCCATTYYCMAFELDTDDGEGMRVQVLSALAAGVLFNGMWLASDRGYTCRGVVQWTLDHGIGYIGTAKGNVNMTNECLTEEYVNRKGETKSRTIIHEKTARGKFAVSTCKDESIVGVIWRDAGDKPVQILSTIGHTAEEIVIKHEKGKKINVTCPSLVKIFVSMFHGVDRYNQLKARFYSLADSFKTDKWTVKLIFGLFDMATTNAWIIYREIFPHKKKRGHKAFYSSLARQMIDYGLASKQGNSPESEVCQHVPRQLECRERISSTSGQSYMYFMSHNCEMCSGPGRRKRSNWA